MFSYWHEVYCPGREGGMERQNVVLAKFILANGVLLRFPLHATFVPLPFVESRRPVKSRFAIFMRSS